MNKIELYLLRKASWQTMRPKLDVLLSEHIYEHAEGRNISRIKAEISYVDAETGEVNVEIYRTYQKDDEKEERGMSITLTLEQIDALSAFVETFHDEVEETV